MVRTSSSAGVPANTKTAVAFPLFLGIRFLNNDINSRILSIKY